ncbi:hypothetical protein SARC_11259 [Sphaeroforma arctica JP610]|uniref:Transglutaminase-like domain-containing protein n=1 Tax=Sphaeroforma arctica JP610 TaxID=667725 RepID=A0A0L0FJM9_9EUKA|nr:hypothetical protein SARC_11259 [Sphaeroforma arctica JP610]KNC76233.1 hypothetical protein SARC_11259 [Sphaeroforma arctica JP610]|eukprot:XP_014150135.1 hypothetical protein SARC_11259 [Sphaeroforma arctica JP610]
MPSVASTTGQEELNNQITSCCAKVCEYESAELQARARACVPTLTLYEKAHREMHSNTHIRDELMKQMLRWYKKDFFSWVDQAVCESCVKFNAEAGLPPPDKTVSVGSGTPTSDDLKYGAARVEVYLCPQCNSQVRFPRYNDPGKLLQTRRGRCGEWANCFTLIARALGYKARFVLDLTDHVWTEVYSDHMRRWVHTDCSEAKYDTPLVYERGWGKKLTYLFAFNAEEVVDVSRRYTQDYNELRQRQTLADHTWTAQAIHAADLQQRRTCTYKVDMDSFNARRAEEETELLSANTSAGGGGEDEGRTSGSVSWRLNRGETTVSGATPLTAVRPEVLYPDEHTHVHTVSDVAKLKRVGACSIETINGDTRTVLTPNECDKVGAAYINTFLPTRTNWVCEFAFAMESSGADGMALVVRSNKSKALGKGGCGLGYSGMLNCLAVEFDSYDSMMECDDPSGNHVSVHVGIDSAVTSHHACSLARTSNVPQLNSGTPRWCRVSYQMDTLTLTVELKTVHTDSYADILSTQIDIPAVVQRDTMLLGFTAATGGIAQKHSIWDVDVRTWS